MKKCVTRFGYAAIGLALANVAHADVGVVSHVKVVSDKVEDVSSLEAWRQSAIKPGMTDQEKALAVWHSAVAYRHQDVPPKEFLLNEADVHDPIQSFNVYGYGQCCCASAHIEALSRYIGLQSRGWAIVAHSVPEVNVGGRWCMLDASLINYFKQPGGSIAGVQEISRNIEAWYAQHPEMRNDNDKLYKFMRDGGWKTGPSVVAGGTGYDNNGWLPAATHGWYSNMQEFGSASKNFQYEYGSAIGYEVNLQLRAGERIVRNWSNKGMHVNMLDGDVPGVLTAVIGKDQLRYSPGFGDIAPGRIGNGAIEYVVPLASPTLRDSALEYENLKSDATPALQVADRSKPGVLVLRMPSSYVYLGGSLDYTAALGAGGSMTVSFSDNNGLDWKPISKASAAGPQKVDLKPLVFRRYDYRLKFELNGSGTGLNELKITNDIQHSQRPLPALAQGDNHIHFNAGTQEGTITVQGSTNPDYKGKNLQFADFHPQLQRIVAPNLCVEGATGTVIIPVATPGDITRVRLGVHYRARDEKYDGFTIDASFNDGKTWKPVGVLEGGYAGYSSYFVFTDVPKDSRAVLVRFIGKQRNTAMIIDERVSVDFKEPHGGFAPVKISYVWDENGQTKQDVHVARSADETYVIHCAGKPLMKSITLELGK